MTQVKFRIKGGDKSPIKMGYLIGDGFVRTGYIYYNLSSVIIVEKEKKDKSELKKFLLSRKVPVDIKDLKFLCSNCRRDLRVHNVRVSVVREIDDLVIWRFVCACGYVKTLSINTKEKENEK